MELTFKSSIRAFHTYNSTNIKMEEKKGKTEKSQWKKRKVKQKDHNGRKERDTRFHFKISRPCLSLLITTQ